MMRDPAGTALKEMPVMIKNLKKGASLVEYGMLAGLVAVVAIGSISALGLKVESTFANVNETLGSASTNELASASSEAAAPPPPTSIAHFEITAAPVGSRSIGYLAARFNNSGGTLDAFNSATFSGSDGLFSNDTGRNFLAYLTGTFAASDLSDTFMTCAHEPGRILPFTGGADNSHAFYSDGVDQPGYFVDGGSYSCDIYR